MTYVKDTSAVDATNYGIDEGHQADWQVGFNTDLGWTKQFTSDISYTTNYKMFTNYAAPFNKFDISWENNLSLQLSTYINMNLRYYLVYDDDVTFDTGRIDDNGDAIMKAKWQMKELVSIGFTYILNKSIYRRKRIN